MGLRSNLARWRRSDGDAENSQPTLTPFPGPGKVGPTEPLVDVMALVGDAVVLDNGTFVRGIEVAPIDLERGDVAVRRKFWSLFAGALRRLRAPLGIQIVVVTRLQDVSHYLAQLRAAANDWQRRAETATDSAMQARRKRMRVCADETAAFLTAAHEQLSPIQHRYLVIVTHNPFPEAITGKAPAKVLKKSVVKAALDKLNENIHIVSA